MSRTNSPYGQHWRHFASCNREDTVHRIEVIRMRLKTADELESEEDKLRFLFQINPPITLAGIDGALAIWDGDARGWSQVGLAHRFYVTGQQIAIAHYEYEKRIVEAVRNCQLTFDRSSREILRLLDCQKPPITLSSPLEKMRSAVKSPFRPKTMFPSDDWMQTLLLSIVFGDEQFSHWAFSLMNSEHPAVGNDWLEERLWTIVYFACCLWKGTSAEIPKRYQAAVAKVRGLFESWTDPERFATSLVEIANLGARARRKALSPIQCPPCQVFPVEVLAILKIRSDLGLTTLPLEHPLVETPLFRVPDKIEPVSDKLLDTIDRAIRQVFPEFSWIWTLQSPQAASPT